MRPTIFHLIGMPGVGKYTVALELARLTDARMVDNHSIANVIFNVLDVDGIKPLPVGTFRRVSQVRAAVLDTLVNLSPAHLSFVFTNVLIGEDEREMAVFREIADAAEARNSVFVPVILSCETGELVRRIVRPDRKARMKLIDPVEGARLNDRVPQFRSDHPNTLELDTSRTTPAEAAQIIVEWRDRLRDG